MTTAAPSRSVSRFAPVLVPVFAVLLAFGGLSFFATSAHALPEAGSILFFPLYDSAPGNGTVIAVTNTFTSMRSCSDGRREGDVNLHYIYFNGDDCREFDRFELLTPGDTLTILADEHNPQQDRGYLVVIAMAPTGGLVNFNHLIGQAIIVQSGLDVSWSYNAVTVEALAGDASNGCDRTNPDDAGNGGDNDFAADFDGVEYEMLTAEVAIPTFFEEGPRFGNMLALMSTAGDYEIETRWLLYNNVEDVFSRTFRFDCWWAGSLSEVSGVATDLDGDPEETGHGTQTGWVSISGRNVRNGAGQIVDDPETGQPITPAIIGVFMQTVRDTDFATGDFLFGRGEKIDGLEVR